MIGYRHLLVGSVPNIPPIEIDETLVMLATDTHFKEGIDGDPLADGAIVSTRYYYTSPELMRKFVTKVNELAPKLVVLLGDVCDMPPGLEIFSDIWGDINPAITKIVIPGNHDYEDTSYEDLTVAYGVDGNTEVGGSKFNQTIALSTTHRVIAADTCFNSADEHSASELSIRMHSTCPAWIQSVLENTTENNVFIFCHTIPQLGDYYPTQATALFGIVTTVMATRPNLRVSWIGGHFHRLQMVGFNQTNNPGYIIPAPLFLPI